MFFIIFLFIILHALTFADIPPGCVPGMKDKNVCFTFQPNKTYFANAEEFCGNLGGHLASVHNMLDNMLITQQSSKLFTDNESSDFWFGANDFDNHGTWAWMDESIFSYTDWEKGQPQNISGADCGAVKIPSGKWMTDDCFLGMKPFVCSIQMAPVTSQIQTTTTTTTTTPKPTTTKPKNCPETWTYFNTTGFCYRVFENQKWLDAETRCKINDAHLVSIHSSDEDQFIGNLAYYPGASDEDFHYQAWIGLFTEDNNKQWKWTDGTPFDYQNWAPGEPDGAGAQNCGGIFLQSFGDIKAYQMADSICDWVVRKFICKKLPS